MNSASLINTQSDNKELLLRDDSDILSNGPKEIEEESYDYDSEEDDDSSIDYPEHIVQIIDENLQVLIEYDINSMPKRSSSFTQFNQLLNFEQNN